MHDFHIHLDPITAERHIEVPYIGHHLVENPVFNKGSAFSEEERESLGLWGILPDRVSTIELQSARVYENYLKKPAGLERYIYLQDLLDRNETLHYRVVLDHLEEMVPDVYTPTVGEGARTFSHIFRRARGLYVSANRIALIERVLASAPFSNVFLIVVTDGQRILGLGDQGIGGMAIPIGKLSLYVLGAGIHPALCLPICIDVGTDNEQLLADKLYLGLNHHRLTGDAYDGVIEEFVKGVKRFFPHAILQWEDFGKQNALRLLKRYQERICSFNDDIQGTGAVTLAAVISGVAARGERLRDQRYVILGMGQAGFGVASALLRALGEEGLSEPEAKERIFPVDQNGLLLEGMPADDYQSPFLKTRESIGSWNFERSRPPLLAEVVTQSRATVLIGVSAAGGAFTQEVLTRMAENSSAPLILALSNPTARSECTPEDVFRATRGRCLVATGTRFPEVKVDGEPRAVSQCNNMFVFPGVGLGAILSMTPRITDGMFAAASRTLAGLVSPAERKTGKLLPEISQMRKVSEEIAFAVVREAREAGLGVRLPDEKLREMTRQAMWDPKYLPYRRAQNI